MKKKNVGKSRRKVLKSIAAGSGVVLAAKSLPEKWTKPVVNSVMLPAHAQTSQLTYSCAITGQGSLFINVIPIPGPVTYTITNTGTGPLTGPNISVTPSSGTMGGPITFNTIPGVLPNPLAPGDTTSIGLTNIDTTTCLPAGSGLITINFGSNETSCTLDIPVTCATLG